jgi:FHA domain
MTMADARLNSIHLELPQRQEFRAARDQLLLGRGDRTLCVEGQSNFAKGSHNLEPGQQAAETVPARFVLVDKDVVYPLNVGLNTIGRMPDNDVVVDDGYVSRRHCAILVHTDDSCELQDVASKNGTLVNGQKIQCPTRLQAGDEIRICTRSLVFVANKKVVSE